MSSLPVAGRPSPLTDCRITSNATKPEVDNDPAATAAGAAAGAAALQPSSAPSFSGVRIVCSEGFDGGLPQTFLLEVQ